MAKDNDLLSDRELEILEQVMQGAANKEIAQVLNISPNTVKVHLRNIYAKLGVSSRTEASMVAVERGLLALPGQATEDGNEPNTAAPLPLVEQVAETPPAATAPAPLTPAQGSLSRRAWLIALVVVGLSLSIALVTQLPLPSVSPATLTAPAEAQFAPTPLPVPLWFRTRPLPAPQAHAALVASGNELYQIGGEVDNQVVDTVYVYDVNARAWSQTAAKPTAVADATAAVLLEIYVPGGRTANGQPTAVVEAYSPANRRWRPVQSLPQPILGGVTLSTGSAIYHLGGWNGESYLADVYAYDPATDVWQPLPAMPTARAFATGGIIGNALYVVGGTDGRETLDVCEYYDPQQAMWHTCPSMTQARQGAGAAVVLDKLYVLGGQENGAQGEVYDPKLESWRIIDTPAATDLPREEMGWLYLGVTNVETQIYTIGGRRSDGALSAEALIYAAPAYQTFIPAVQAGENGSADE